MKTVYFDNCVFGHLGDGRMQQVDVELVRGKVTSGAIRIPFSMTNMDELARYCSFNVEGGRRAVALTRSLCSGQAVRVHFEILKDELRACLDRETAPSIFMASGSDEEVFFRRLWDVLATNPASMASDLRTFSDREQTEGEAFMGPMRAARAEGERVRREEGRDPSLTYVSWRESQFDGGVCVEGWIRHALQQAGRPERRWRRILERLGSYGALRMYLEVNVAYSYALIADSTSTATPFNRDLLHAIYGGRVDALVSNDGQFLRILRYIPPSRRCPVFDWDGFVAWARTVS